MEAKNNAEAFDLIVNLVHLKKEITQDVIQLVHKLVTTGILEKPGQYRTGNVSIIRSDVKPPSFQKIIPIMDEYIHQLKKLNLHPIKKAAYIHHQLVKIHPFFDGNGRVARLISNLYLMKKGYPPIIIQKEERKKYYSALKKADHGNLSEFATFIAQAMNASLQYYLSCFIDDERLVPLSDLSKKTRYSQEYLSLRARQGKLDAVKIENIWYASMRALKEYQQKLKK